MDHLEAIMAALRTIRAQRVGSELKYLHPLVAEALDSAGLAHRREVRLGARRRVDFLVSGGVAIEVKKGRPGIGNLVRQLERYAESDDVSAIILVLERAVPLPNAILGKPIRSISLNMLWGPAV